MLRNFALSLGAGMALAAAVHAAGDIFPYKVHERSLDNGLKVVAIPYDSPGTVAYYTVVRTGSREEVEAGKTGFAHFFEHMMFRGTEKYPPARYNDVLKRMGADSNAYTSDDETVYHIVGPASELPTLMDIEADRFQNLKYTEEAFRTEALAVLGEYNKNASNPFFPMFEKLRGLAFTRHTYKHTTMGFVEDIKAMPEQYPYSLQFFDRFYRPENVTLLIVGDVEPEKVFALAKQHYGGWKKGYKPVDIATEPPQGGQKKAHIDWPNPVRPHLIVGYRMPGFSTATVDIAALDLIGQLLFSDSAPLYQELVVEKQWVDFIGGGGGYSRDPGLFTVTTRVKSEDLVPKVKETVDRYIQELAAKPVDAKRLDRIRSHLRYGFALGLDTPDNVAGQATQAIVAAGDVGAINGLFAQYEKVTPADVQRVARETFKTDSETVVSLSYPSQAGADKKGGAQ